MVLEVLGLGLMRVRRDRPTERRCDRASSIHLCVHHLGRHVALAQERGKVSANLTRQAPQSCEAREAIVHMGGLLDRVGLEQSVALGEGDGDSMSVPESQSVGF